MVHLCKHELWSTNTYSHQILPATFSVMLVCPHHIQTLWCSHWPRDLFSKVYILRTHPGCETRDAIDGRVCDNLWQLQQEDLHFQNTSWIWDMRCDWRKRYKPPCLSLDCAHVVKILSLVNDTTNTMHLQSIIEKKASWVWRVRGVGVVRNVYITGTVIIMIRASGAVPYAVSITVNRIFLFHYTFYICIVYISLLILHIIILYVFSINCRILLFLFNFNYLRTLQAISNNFNLKKYNFQLKWKRISCLSWCSTSNQLKKILYWQIKSHSFAICVNWTPYN